MITKAEVNEIFTNQICPICKSNFDYSLTMTDIYYHSCSCNIFSIGLQKISKFIVFKHQIRNCNFIIELFPNVLYPKTSYLDYASYKNNLVFDFHKIPESQKDLNQLYNNVMKMKVFK